MQRLSLSRLLSSGVFCRVGLRRLASDLTRVEMDDGGSRSVSESWLRFNCSCDACRDSRNHQRRLAPSGALGARVAKIRRLGDKFGVEWTDGHKSTFAYDSVRRLLNPELSQAADKSSPTLWGETTRPDTTPVPAAAFMSDESARVDLLRRLRRFGFAMVDGVDSTEAATARVVERLAPAMPTFFGVFWTFTADGARQDSAFSNEQIGLHTDTTYLQDGAGLQVFHALVNAPVGGTTVLADGFNAIRTLASESPDDLRLLSTHPIWHRYLETDSDGSCIVHVRAHDRVVKLLGNSPYQIRYNPLDIESLGSLAQDKVAEYLNAYARLSEILSRPKAALKLDLRPGTVLFIDNWRVLHARTNFSGRRVLTGCYVSRDDWTSAARVAGVLNDV